MEKVLKFCFKGQRTYLHSTDIFNTFISLFGRDIQQINFSFYKKTNKNIILKDSQTASNNKLLVFSFSFLKEGKEFKFYGYESEENINCKYDYDESLIVKGISLDHFNRCGILSSSTKYSFIEHLVALTKEVHLNFLPTNKGKWFFAKLQLLKIPENFLPLQVCLKQQLGLKLTQSSIFINNSLIGSIYFSLLEEK